MPIESAADLAAFFNPEEFGEAVHWNGVARLAIWDRPSGDLETPNGRYRVETNTFSLPVTGGFRPASGDTVVVDRLDTSFTVIGEPGFNRDGTIWVCEAAPT